MSVLSSARRSEDLFLLTLTLFLEAAIFDNYFVQFYFDISYLISTRLQTTVSSFSYELNKVLVKISVVYSVNKSLALYSIYSLCYLQTKSLRTSSRRKKKYCFDKLALSEFFKLFQTSLGDKWVYWSRSMCIAPYMACLKYCSQ